MLRFVGNGDQKKFTKNPRHFSMQNSQANTKKILTKMFWRGGNVKKARKGRSGFFIGGFARSPTNSEGAGNRREPKIVAENCRKSQIGVHPLRSTAFGAAPCEWQSHCTQILHRSDTDFPCIAQRATARLSQRCPPIVRYGILSVFAWPNWL